MWSKNFFTWSLIEIIWSANGVIISILIKIEWNGERKTNVTKRKILKSWRIVSIYWRNLKTLKRKGIKN